MKWSLEQLLNDPDPEIQTHLKYSGWADIKKLTDKEAKLALNKKFFVISGGRVYGTVKELGDIEKMQGYEITGLANGGTLLQEVSLKSVLTETQYRHYLDSKQKEIDKSKKILEHHGVKLNEQADP